MNRRRSFWFVVRVVVSAALLAFLLSRLDVRNMVRFLSGADWLLVALTLVTVAIDRSLMAGRWIVLLDGLGISAPRARVVKIFFLSTFFGSFLPTGIGGEAIRAVSFSRLSSKGVESIASVVMDRIMGMLSMLLTGLVALIVFYRIYPHPALLATVLALSAAALAGLALLLSPSGAPAGSGSGRTRERDGWRAGGHRMAPFGAEGDRGHGALPEPARVAGSGSLDVGRCSGPTHPAGLPSFGSDDARLTPGLLLLLRPAHSLDHDVAHLGEWSGTTNLAYVALFGSVGMDPDGAFVLSVLILALGVIGNLPGGVIYALESFTASESASGKENRRHGDLERSSLVESAR